MLGLIKIFGSTLQKAFIATPFGFVLNKVF